MQSGISTLSRIHIHRTPQLSHPLVTRMPAVCVTCGAQYPTDASLEPERCLICEDERQYVGLNGQKWINREELQRSHKNVLREEEPDVLGIGTEPSFAIGQRALLIQTGRTPSELSVIEAAFTAFCPVMWL